jgi:hypothetical protein
VGKGDKPAEIPLNPRTHEAIDQAVGGRTDRPLLLNQWGSACSDTTPLRSLFGSRDRSASSGA